MHLQIYILEIKDSKREWDQSFSDTIQIVKQGLHFSKKQRIIINTIISCIVLQKVRKQDKNTRAGMRVLKQKIGIATRVGMRDLQAKS